MMSLVNAIDTILKVSEIIWLLKDKTSTVFKKAGAI